MKNRGFGKVSGEINRVWEDHWEPILVSGPNATLDIDQLKRELYDFWVISQEVQRVYSEITDHRITSPRATAEAVLTEYRGLRGEDMDWMVEDFKEQHEQEWGYAKDVVEAARFTVHELDHPGYLYTVEKAVDGELRDAVHRYDTHMKEVELLDAETT